MSKTNRFIDPVILASLANLPFLARTVVEGFMLGRHGIPRSGSGLEFSQYRSYQPGDDLRLLDWKMFARSDRYYLRETEVESSINLRFALDTSASMAHLDSNGISKFDYARFMVASLAHLGFHQGDAIGLYSLGEQADQLPPRHTRRHYFRFLEVLSQLNPGGLWPQWAELENLTAAHQGRELMVLISDLYQEDDRIDQALARLSGTRNELVVFHLLGRNELELPWRGPVIFEDLETGTQLETVPDLFRDRFRLQMEEHCRLWQTRLGDMGISYHRFFTDQPLDEVLHQFLKQRLRSGRV